MFDALPTAKRHWVYSMFFLEIPKSASSSLHNLLGERNLLKKHKGLIHNKFSSHPLFKGHFDTRHATPEMIRSVFSNQVNEFFSFAVIRSPIDRLASSYSFGKENRLWKLYDLPENISADSYIDWLYKSKKEKRQDILILLPQTTWTHSSIFRPTEVLRFENLQENWKSLLKKYDIKGLSETIPHLNASKRVKEQIFSKESLSKIREIYRTDYELLYHDAELSSPPKKN